MRCACRKWCLNTVERSIPMGRAQISRMSASRPRADQNFAVYADSKDTPGWTLSRKEIRRLIVDEESPIIRIRFSCGRGATLSVPRSK